MRRSVLLGAGCLLALSACAESPTAIAAPDSPNFSHGAESGTCLGGGKLTEAKTLKQRLADANGNHWVCGYETLIGKSGKPYIVYEDDIL